MVRSPSPSKDPVVRKVLYLSYDGLTDPLGQSQVLPYLLGCAAAGHRITVVSFEKAERMAVLGDAVAAVCKSAAIEWHPRPFRTWPPVAARALDQRDFNATASGLAGREHFDLVHCRSYPAAVVGLEVKRRFGIPLLFDMRGFWPDSRREGGRWPSDRLLGRLLYRQWKAHERKLLGGADAIIAMAQAAADAVTAMPGYAGAPVSVIPCCADFDLFTPASPVDRASARAELGIDAHAPVMLYVGSLGTIYRLGDQLRLFAAARERLPGLKLLFVGRHAPGQILAAAGEHGVPLDAEDLRIVAAERPQMARWISAGDFGTCFYTPTFSSLNVSPTKLAEYLACGLPVIGNHGVGDVSEILTRIDAGMALPDFSNASIAAAASALPTLLNRDGAAIRERAQARFDLPLAVEAYRKLYVDLFRPVKVASA
jgi:glycosyltransferase involved in cell wall biosynthesis